MTTELETYVEYFDLHIRLKVIEPPSDLSTGKHHLAQTLGDAEVSAEAEQVGAVSHGGTAVGASINDKGYNIAAAAPGEGHAFSGRFPEAAEPDFKDIEPQGSFEDGLAVGALGGAGGAVAGGTAAACCCGCVIL